MTSSFPYKALQLNEIRVLGLDPGSGSDVLSGSLIVTQHDPERSEIPRYEALSYAWGDQADPDHITLRSSDIGSDVDNDGSSCTFPIGRNLGAALRQLRQDADTRVLWCDSICIDQEDLEERAAQVRHMGAIFKYASRVIAWLGPADDHSRLAFRTLSEVAAYIDFTNWEQYYLNSIMRLKPDTAEQLLGGDTELPRDRQQWQALHALLSRPWFRRLWVRQEITLGGKEALVMAGADSILWMHLAAACELIKNQTWVAALPATHYMDGLVTVTSISTTMPHGRRSLSNFIALTNDCEATDPRDYVYGLLGIASASSTSKIVVDYNKDVKEVFFDTVVQSFTQHRHLVLLSFCNSASKPTWIPDLHRTQGLRTLFGGMAGRALPSEMRVLSKTHAEARGIECDAIGEVLGPIDEKESSSDDQLQSLVIEAARRFLGPSPDVWTQDKLWHFCRAMHFYHSVSPTKLDSVKSHLAHGVNPDTTAPALPGDSERQALLLTYFLRGRSLYLTRDGYIMMGPRGCQPGDVVCVFLGSSLPTVLRPTDNGEYEIKGPASHPALFFGEALLGELPEGWQMKRLATIGSPVFERPDGEQQDVDPRLDGIPIPAGWELRRRRKSGRARFYNEKEGHWTRFDPRVSEMELLKRGVQIQTFTLT